MYRVLIAEATPLRLLCAILTVGLALAVFTTTPNAQASPVRRPVADPVRYVDLVFDQVERHNNLTYGTAIDKPTGHSVNLLLDIYEPAGDTESHRPVFVFLFGGGFVAGNKEQEPRQYCELMAKRGYVAVAINYRINQGNVATVGIPAAVSDTRQAVGWLRKHAADYRLDADRIVLGGSSAGAIASLFTAYTDVERQPGDRSSDVALVMDLWGALYNQVNDMQTGEPPLIIIHGTADTLVPFSEAEKLRARAEAVDIPYSFHPLEGQGHAPYMPVELMKLVAAFAYEQLWGKGALPTATTQPSAPSATPTRPASATPTVQPSATPTAAAPPSTATPTTVLTAVPTGVPQTLIYLPVTWRN